MAAAVAMDTGVAEMDMEETDSAVVVVMEVAATAAAADMEVSIVFRNLQKISKYLEKYFSRICNKIFLKNLFS